MRSPEFADILTEWPPPEVTACRCGRGHAIGTRSARVGSGLLGDLAEWIPAPSAGEGPLLLLADPDTWDAAGSRAAERLRRAGRSVREVVLGRRPKADDRTIDRLRPALVLGPSRIVAVGAGTVSDLGKSLAAAAGVPLATVGTAASMNGYASSIVALTVAGLKVTRPAPAPDVLLLDTDVLAAAPARLTRAGFGDLLSKPVSGADWILSNAVFGEPVCAAAQTLADGAVARARAHASGLGRGGFEAIAALAEALAISGLSMSVAGVSSPASGGEHLISHYLDISADGWNREPRLHGEQVAVGTRVSLALYRRLREAGPPDASTTGPAEDSDAEIVAFHRHLGPDARAAVLAQAVAKAARPPVRSDRRRLLAEGWTGLWTALDRSLDAAAGLEDDLAAAGVPRTFAEIDLCRERAAALIRIARHMRNRYTVLDAAADLAYLERWSEEIAADLGGAG